jgi:MFS family permease
MVFMNQADAMSVRRWMIVVALFLLNVLNSADKSSIGLAAGPIMAEMHLSHAQFGRISSSFFMFFAVSTVFFGILSNRIKARWLLAILVTFWTVSQLPILAYATPTALLLSRILLGAGEGPTYILGIHSLYKWFPERERLVPTTLFGTGSQVGTGVIAPAVTWIIIKYGWRTAFLTLAVVGLVWVAVWLAVGKEGPLGSKQSATEPRSVPAVSNVDGFVPYWRMLTSRTCIGVILCGFCAYITFSIALIWLPSYLEEVDGYSMRTTSFVLTLPSFLSIVVCPLLGWWSQNMQQRGVSTRYARGAMNGSVVAITGLTIFLIPIVRTEWLSMVMIAVAFSITSFTYSAGVAIISEISPPAQRGAMLGIAGACQTVAGLLAPLAMGYIIDLSSSPISGYKNGMLLTGALAVFGGIIGGYLINPSRDLRLFSRWSRTSFRNEATIGVMDLPGQQDSADRG